MKMSSVVNSLILTYCTLYFGLYCPYTIMTSLTLAELGQGLSLTIVSVIGTGEYGRKNTVVYVGLCTNLT